MLVGRAWSEISLFGADLVAAIVRSEVNRSEGAICFEVRRLVDKGILAAQLFLNALECFCHIFHAEGIESASAGCDSHCFENVIAAVTAGTIVGADRVDCSGAALAHLD